MNAMQAPAVCRLGKEVHVGVLVMGTGEKKVFVVLPPAARGPHEGEEGKGELHVTKPAALPFQERSHHRSTPSMSLPTAVRKRQHCIITATR